MYKFLILLFSLNQLFAQSNNFEGVIKYEASSSSGSLDTIIYIFGKKGIKQIRSNQLKQKFGLISEIYWKPFEFPNKVFVKSGNNIQTYDYTDKLNITTKVNATQLDSTSTVQLLSLNLFKAKVLLDKEYINPPYYNQVEYQFYYSDLIKYQVFSNWILFDYIFNNTIGRIPLIIETCINSDDPNLLDSPFKSASTMKAFEIIFKKQDENIISID